MSGVADSGVAHSYTPVEPSVIPGLVPGRPPDVLAVQNTQYVRYPNHAFEHYEDDGLVLAHPDNQALGFPDRVSGHSTDDDYLDDLHVDEYGDGTFSVVLPTESPSQNLSPVSPPHETGHNQSVLENLQEDPDLVSGSRTPDPAPYSLRQWVSHNTRWVQLLF